MTKPIKNKSSYLGKQIIWTQKLYYYYINKFFCDKLLHKRTKRGVNEKAPKN